MGRFWRSEENWWLAKTIPVAETKELAIEVLKWERSQDRGNAESSKLHFFFVYRNGAESLPRNKGSEKMCAKVFVVGIFWKVSFAQKPQMQCACTRSKNPIILSVLTKSVFIIVQIVSGASSRAGSLECSDSSSVLFADAKWYMWMIREGNWTLQSWNEI